ncbi:hypothetical protein HF086_003739 [Spodoptera exigua]|uniref:Uncharacterized protein n=1 Tax=Spodoptera exigua TaxID=7107 RepID=A0A922SNI6_SPOEX|nr:hypothetical protein HF086_003739 [Spodoptera exigua]
MIAILLCVFIIPQSLGKDILYKYLDEESLKPLPDNYDIHKIPYLNEQQIPDDIPIEVEEISVYPEPTIKIDRPHIPTYYLDRWNYYQSLFPRVKPSIPVALKWEDIEEIPVSDTTKLHHTSLQMPIHESTPYPRKYRLHTSPTTTRAPVEEEEHTTLAPVAKDHLKQETSGDSNDVAAKPVLDGNSPYEIIKKPVYRGSYKFSWDDINDMHKPSPPKMSELKVNPNRGHQQTTHNPINHEISHPPIDHTVPPVPTLSPWYDGYGK